MFGEIFRAVAEALGIVAKRQELDNASDVKEGAKRVAEQNALDQRTENVADRNLNEVRKDISEN